MKKSKRFLTGIIALSAIILFSCNNFTGGKVFERENPFVSGEKTLLTISIDKMLTSAQRNALINENIMPSPWTTERAGNLTFTLTGGHFEPGETEPSISVPANTNFTYAELIGGSASILLDPTTWKLKLTAYKGTDVVLVSNEVNVNLYDGAKTATFTMAVPAAGSNATGSAAVTIKFIKPSNFARVVYGIYDGALPNSDVVGTDVIASASDAEKTTLAADLTAVNAGIDSYSFTYTNTAIKAGNYHFNATFYDAADKIINFYSDSIQIDGGNETAKTIDIGDSFNKPATKPTALTVAYSYNDTSYAAMKVDELTDPDDIKDKFYATFTWDDASDNETGFELTITDTAAAAANPDTYEPTVYTSTSTVSAGSLAASSTSATIELDTGKVYTAKIRAVNYFTPADSETTSLSGNVNLFTIAYTWGNNGDPTINSTIKTGDTTQTAEDTVVYVVPLTTATGYSLIGSNTAVFPYIYRTGYEFIKWFDDDDPTEAAYTLDNDNTGNIVLCAYWQSRLGVSIVMPNYSAVADYALVDSYSEAAVRTISGAQADPETPVTLVLTPNTGLTDVTWTLYNNSDYENAITDNISVDDSTKVLTWTITDSVNSVSVAAGTYRIAVSGTKDGETVTGNIYIKITR